MKRFRFYWRDGVVEEGEGMSASDAFQRLGYGGGAIRALDYFRELPQQSPDIGSAHDGQLSEKELP